MTRNTQIFIAVIILITGGVWLYTITEPRQDNGPNNSASTTQSVDITNSWERHENTAYNFSVAHPPEATVQAEGIEEKNHIKFMYLGSPQATGEIQDGFTFTVSTYRKSALDTSALTEFVQEDLQDYRQTGNIVMEPKMTNFHEYQALKYQINNLGTTTITTLERDDTFVSISHNITDPNDNGYDEIVNKMKSSFTFLE